MDRTPARSDAEARNSRGYLSARSAFDRLRTRYREIASMDAPPKSPRAYGNWIRANLELWRRSGRITARPIKLTVDPTNVCQLRCPLCPTGARVHDRDRGGAQLEMFRTLMSEIGEQLFFIDFFNWGEPLINLHVEDLIREANAKGVTTNLSSNLSLPLSADRIDRLVTSGLNSLIVSLDGASRATYAQYRRAGHFDLVIDNMRRIIAARRRLGLTRPLVTWQFLVFAFNEHELDLARAMAADIGVDCLTLRAPFLDEGRFAIGDEDRAAMKTWAPTDPRFNRYMPGNKEYVDPEAKLPSRLRCGWHYMSTAINWDGSVAPCCTVFEKKDDFGSIGRDGKRASYMDVVNNQTFVAVRDSFAGRKNDGHEHVCDRCPTPSLMSYHHHLNRQVLLFTLVRLAETMRGRRRRWRHDEVWNPATTRHHAAIGTDTMEALDENGRPADTARPHA